MEVRALQLTNFRQYGKRKFEFPSGDTVIVGDNTAGKSTLLDAVHFLINGRSIWSNSPAELCGWHDGEFFRLTADIEFQGLQETRTVKYSNKKVIFEINGKTVSRKKFTKGKYAFVFAPEFIELIMTSSSYRRKFLNEYLSVLHPEYGKLWKDLNTVLRQRNAVLKRLARRLYETGEFPDKSDQLDLWTEKFIRQNAEVFSLKEKFINQINQYKSDDRNVMMWWTLEKQDLFTLQSGFESWLKDRVMEYHRRDIVLGYTNIGLHRDDWALHAEYDMKKFGSRGEKRLAVVGLLSKLHQMFIEEGFATIILVDDLSSELGHEFLRLGLARFAGQDVQRIITTLSVNDPVPDIDAEYIYLTPPA